MKRRKETLVGETWRINTECGSFYVTFNVDNDTLFEINMQLGKCGNCQRGLLQLSSDQLSKLIQVLDTKDLKKFIQKKWVGFSCGNPFFHKGKTYNSCIDWVGVKMLEKIKEEQQHEKEQEQKKA